LANPNAFISAALVVFTLQSEAVAPLPLIEPPPLFVLENIELLVVTGDPFVTPEEAAAATAAAASKPEVPFRANNESEDVESDGKELGVRFGRFDREWADEKIGE
jgi:hypothetical protein